MKYVIEYIEEMWYCLEIEADSADEARKKFWSGQSDFDSAQLIGGEIHPDISIREKGSK